MARDPRALDRRRLLRLGVVAMLVVGLGAALIPFRGYLGTDEIRIEPERVAIPLTALPADRVREIAWGGERLFVVSGARPVVVAVPYEGGAYLLPHGTAGGGTVPCALFGAVGERFRCMDPSTPVEWRKHAIWSQTGTPLGEGFPALRLIAYRIEGNTLVITALEDSQ